MLLAEEHTGQRLDLDVDERVALGLRERAHLLLDEHDVVDHLLRQRRHDLGDLLGVETEARRGPLVELSREYLRTAASPVAADVGDDPAHSLGDLAPARCRRTTWSARVFR